MTEPVTLRRKPIDLAAIRWDGDNDEAVQDFAEGKFRTIARTRAEILDELHDTWVALAVGDWILRGVKGEFYPVASEIIDDLYEILPAG